MSFKNLLIAGVKWPRFNKMSPSNSDKLCSNCWLFNILGSKSRVYTQSKQHQVNFMQNRWIIFTHCSRKPLTRLQKYTWTEEILLTLYYSSSYRKCFSPLLFNYLVMCRHQLARSDSSCSCCAGNCSQDVEVSVRALQLRIVGLSFFFTFLAGIIA